MRKLLRSSLGSGKEALSEYGERLAGKIGELEEKIYEQAGKKFNLNSPKQLGVVLFEDLRMPYAKKTKTGYSTNADILEKLAPDHPIILGNNVSQYLKCLIFEVNDR